MTSQFNPFAEIQDWDQVTSDAGVPFGPDQIVKIQDCGVRVPEYQSKDGSTVTGKPQLFFDLYFPEHNLNHLATFTITGSRGSTQMIKGVLEKLEIQTGPGTANTMPFEIEQRKGWTVKVDVYEGQDKNDPTKKYKNVRFKGVEDRSSEALPF